MSKFWHSKLDQWIGKHFKVGEIVCPCGCSLDFIDPFMIDVADLIREEKGRAQIITSACRCASYNKKIGGKVLSAHGTREGTRFCENGICQALDFDAVASGEKYLIVDIARQKGIKRIGVGCNFIHLDSSKKLPQRKLFTYPAIKNKY